MINTTLRFTLSALFSASACAAAPQFNCAALQLSGAALPAGYSGQCASPGYLPAVGSNVESPGDPGVAIDIFGSATRSADQMYGFTLNAFPLQTLRSHLTTPVYGVDFTPDGSQLFAISSESAANFPRWLGLIGQPAGDFVPIAAIAGLQPFDTVNGFAIDPRSGVAYLSTSGGSPISARLYRVNLSTAAATFVGSMSAPTDPVGTIMIALAINCEGLLYAHNISDDALYSVSRVNGAVTLIGSHGLSANFAQGMDFDNSDGQLYAFMMLASGENRFGRLDTTTGAFTTLANNDPAGEFEGAIPGVCPATDAMFADGFEG